MSPGVVTTGRGWGPERGQKTAMGSRRAGHPPPSLYPTTNTRDLDALITTLTVLSTFQGTVRALSTDALLAPAVPVPQRPGSRSTLLCLALGIKEVTTLALAAGTGQAWGPFLSGVNGQRGGRQVGRVPSAHCETTETPPSAVSIRCPQGCIPSAHSRAGSLLPLSLQSEPQSSHDPCIPKPAHLHAHSAHRTSSVSEASRPGGDPADPTPLGPRGLSSLHGTGSLGAPNLPQSARLPGLESGNVQECGPVLWAVAPVAQVRRGLWGQSPQPRWGPGVRCCQSPGLPALPPRVTLLASRLPPAVSPD